MILILFTTYARCTLADELARQGHEVFEALAISEVLALAEQYPESGVIIAPEVGNVLARLSFSSSHSAKELKKERGDRVRRFASSASPSQRSIFFLVGPEAVGRR
jgi:DNA-directed RNA polymerase specialized sigma24 family protein